MGPTKDVLISTLRFLAAHIRSTYELRPAIEERQGQYKCFARSHADAFLRLLAGQALMVLLASAPAC